MMEEALEQRVAELKVEFEAGQKLLAELDAQRTSTKETLLRISGAVQVLEELLSQAPVESDGGELADGAVTSPSVKG